MNWSRDILESILDSPFISELSEGCLEYEKFIFFLQQDILFLRQFSKGLKYMSKNVLNGKYQELLEKFADEIAKEEYSLKSEFDLSLESVEATPSCLLYTSYILKEAYENIPHRCVSAYFSCFWVYYKVGKNLIKNSKKNNPFQKWIDYYHSDDFSENKDIFKKMIYDIIDNDENKLNEAKQVFRDTCKMEKMFWDSAYNLEQFFKAPKMLKPKCVLTIAGSDSGGGAGIQSDLNTFRSCGVFGTSVITCLTAQNSQGVYGVFPSSSTFVRDQIITVIKDFDIQAIKIGMLFDKDIIQEVATTLRELTNIKIILDPVMISTSGHQLLKDESISELCSTLMPLCEIVTPNLDETHKLLSLIENNELKDIKTLNEMEKASKLLMDHFKLKSILIKGGHLVIDNNCIDLLNFKGEISYYTSQHIKGTNSHGSGCSLSSAITSFTAKKYSLPLAVKMAKKYVHQAIENGFKLGKGENGTLNHFNMIK